MIPKKVAGGAAVLLSVVCLAAIGVLAGTSFMDARRPAAPVAPAEPPPVRPSPVDVPPPPTIRTVSRSEFVEAARRAAAAFTSGVAVPASDSLVGRRFTLRLPFACGAEPAPTDPAVLTRDPETGALRITVRALDWTGSFQPPAADAPAPEAAVGGPPAATAARSEPVGIGEVRGFWIRRPWLDSESCPAAATGVAPAPAPADDAVEAPAAAARPVAAAAAAETVGLAVFRSESASRAGRASDGVYEATVQRDPAAPVAVADLRVVLTGRVTGFEGRNAFRCRAPSPDERPVCVARVELDAIAVTNARTGASLATWEIAQINGVGR